MRAWKTRTGSRFASRSARKSNWISPPPRHILNSAPDDKNKTMSTLTITRHQKANAAGQSEVTLALDGHLDNSTVASLDVELRPTLAAHPAQLIFDLAGLKFVTSAGIRAFFVALKQQKQHGGHVSFVHLQPQIQEVFDIMGKLPDMRVFKDKAELDAYLLLGEEDGAPFAFANDAELDVYLRARQRSYPQSETSPDKGPQQS